MLPAREARAHGALGALALGRRRRDVVGVAARAVADDLAEDRRRRAPRRAPGSRGHHGAAVAQDEAVAVLVERAAGGLGSSLRVDSAFMLAKPAIVRPVIAASDPPVTMTSASPSRIMRYESPMACADEAQADTVAKFGPLSAVAHGDEARRRCRDEHRDEERRDPVGPLVSVGGAVVLEGLHAADAAADDDAGAIRGRARFSASPACVTAWCAAAMRVLGEEVVALGFLAVHVLQRVEPLHLAGEADLKRGGVELRDRRGPGPAREQAGPGVLDRRCRRASRARGP